jgi:hypothetical protein
MFFVLFGAAAGAYLALRRYRVFVLAPAVVFFAAGALVAGIVAGHDPRTIAVEVIGATASTQLGFVAVSLTVYLRATSPTMMLQSIQMAIGQELTTVFEIPRRVPPEMAILIRKLQTRR